MFQIAESKFHGFRLILIIDFPEIAKIPYIPYQDIKIYIYFIYFISIKGFRGRWNQFIRLPFVPDHFFFLWNRMNIEFTGKLKHPYIFYFQIQILLFPVAESKFHRFRLILIIDFSEIAKIPNIPCQDIKIFIYLIFYIN